MKYYLAVDIGASSGRHLLCHIENNKICIEEIYRFKNGFTDKNGVLCWNVDELYKNILEGLKACKKLSKLPLSMGIDTWGVDFLLLDKENKIIGDSVSYRDSRTAGMKTVCEKIISQNELYSKAGLQYQPFNTIYQLLYLKEQKGGELEKAESFLMIPDYFNFLLTGKKSNEYTNSTTTNLVNAAKKDWDRDLIKKLGLPEKIFGKISPAGTVLGKLSDAVKAEVGFDTTVVLPATHDTGSAFLSVPANGDDSVFISSGTWSLMGKEIMKPITTEESRQLNFTNEGGYKYRYRYLKNIMGLWMIQNIKKENGDRYSFADLEKAARETKNFTSVVDVNDEAFLAPKSMTKAVEDYCARSGQKVPETIGELMCCVYASLAKCYGDTLLEIEKMTGKKYKEINIVGGGSKDGYLCTLTSKRTGLPVFAGPTEGTAIGNLGVQMIVGGEIKDINTLRSMIRESFEVKKFESGD